MPREIRAVGRMRIARAFLPPVDSKQPFRSDHTLFFQKLQILCDSVHTHLQGRGNSLLGDGPAVIYEMIYFAFIYFFISIVVIQLSS